MSGAPAHLATNIRHWRNWEIGSYVQDDWKISKHLTLNLGIRYDLYTRHTELNNLATTFLKGPGQNFIVAMRTVEPKDATLQNGTQWIAWDAAAKQIRS